MNISLGNYNIYVQIIYKNNRNIYFRFDENANLIVTCPKRTLNDEISRLIIKNETSLIKMYERALSLKKYNEEFWYLGKRYNIVYDSNIDNVYLNGDFIYAKDKTLLDIFIEDETYKVFNEEIDICRKCFNNLPSFTLKIKYMKTRWGVCNTKNYIITLNSELIKKKVELIDYVIIHEMAHFYEGNHSKNFWNIVSKACPNYKIYRGELKK